MLGDEHDANYPKWDGLATKENIEHALTDLVASADSNDTISFHQGKWQAVQIGGDALATRAQMLENKWYRPNEKSQRAWVVNYEFNYEWLAYSDTKNIEDGEFFIDDSYLKTSTKSTVSVDEPQNFEAVLSSLREKAIQRMERK